MKKIILVLVALLILSGITYSVETGNTDVTIIDVLRTDYNEHIYSDIPSLKVYTLPSISLKNYYTSGSKTHNRYYMRGSGSGKVNVKEVCQDPDNSQNILVKFTFSGRNSTYTNYKYIKSSSHRSNMRFYYGDNHSRIISGDRSQSSRKKKKYKTYAYTKYYYEGTLYVVSIPKSNPKIEFENYVYGNAGKRMGRDYWRGEVRDTKNLIVRIDAPILEILNSNIKVRKDTDKITVNYVANRNMLVKFYDNFGTLMFEKNIAGGTNSFDINKDDLISGIYSWDLETIASGWTIPRDNAITFDVDTEAYENYHAPSRAINDTEYDVYTPGLTTLYLLPYSDSLGDSIASIQNNNIYSTSLNKGWSEITFPASLNNQTFKAYAVSSSGTILKEYYLSIQELGDLISAYRTLDYLFLDTEVPVEEIAYKSLYASKDQISVLGAITMAMSADGIIEAEYEIMYEDYEEDPQKAYGYTYVHDPSVFENNQGVAAFNGILQLSPITNFNKVGLYEMTFSVQDNANSSDEVHFDNYDKWSNPVKKTILIHRAPFAEVSVAFTKNPTTGKYHVYSVNKDGYDLDHISEANKGVVDSQTRWKASSDSDWITGEPSGYLSMADNYLVEYRVKDIEGAWSSWASAFIEETRSKEIVIETSLNPSYPTAISPTSNVLVTSTVHSSYPVSSVTGTLAGVNLHNLTKISTSGDKTVWTCSYNIQEPLADGDYNFHSVATNSIGTQATDDDLVKTISNRPPAINIVDTNGGADIYYGDDIDVVVDVSDPDLGQILVTEVKVYNPSGTLVSTVPGSYTVYGNKTIRVLDAETVMGTYTVTAKVTDSYGETDITTGTFEVKDILVPDAGGDFVTFTSSSFMRGDNVLADIQTLGGVKAISLTIDPEMQSVEERAHVATSLSRNGGASGKAYQSPDGIYDYNLQENIVNKTNRIGFVTYISADQSEKPDFDVTLKKDGSRNRAPYLMTIKVYRKSVVRTVTVNLEIQGDVRETIKIEY